MLFMTCLPNVSITVSGDDAIHLVNEKTLQGVDEFMANARILALVSGQWSVPAPTHFTTTC